MGEPTWHPSHQVPPAVAGEIWPNRWCQSCACMVRGHISGVTMAGEQPCHVADRNGGAR